MPDTSIVAMLLIPQYPLGAILFYAIAPIPFIVKCVSLTVQAYRLKIVAYSTLSQLRFMFLTLRLGMPLLALLHLLTHATFKSTLFIAVGAILHLSLGSQEYRIKTTYMRSTISITILRLRLLAIMGASFTGPRN